MLAWVRAPVGLLSFSAPVIFCDSVWIRARAASSNRTVMLVLAWFQADWRTNLSRVKVYPFDMWLGSFFGRVLAQQVRDPGFESW